MSNTRHPWDVLLCWQQPAADSAEKLLSLITLKVAAISSPASLTLIPTPHLCCGQSVKHQANPSVVLMGEIAEVDEDDTNLGASPTAYLLAPEYLPRSREAACRGEPALLPLHRRGMDLPVVASRARCLSGFPRFCHWSFGEPWAPTTQRISRT